MMNIDKPCISIGLPVYNGENYLEEAIQSILSQTFKDFELIISDNASIDNTQKICKDYEKKDTRIRYFRNNKNVGASLNYNLIFDLSRCKYFKWAAHDDICAPDFLEKCLEILESDTSIVLCYPRTTFIDENGKELGNHIVKYKADSFDPVKRFKPIISEWECLQVFGLIRSSALANTRLIESYAHGDGVLLTRLSLLGRFYEIPENLFFSREHPQMSTIAAKSDRTSFTLWFDPSQSGRILLPQWRILLGYFDAVNETVNLSLSQRICCFLYLINWMRWSFRNLLEDLIIASKKCIQNRLNPCFREVDD